MHSELLISQTARLKEISTKLKSFNCGQSSLISIELLFFDALSILRSIDNEEKQNTIKSLLAIKENEYKRTQEYYRSVKTLEKTIRQFRFSFKKALDGVLGKSLSFNSSPIT